MLHVVDIRDALDAERFVQVRSFVLMTLTIDDVN